MRDLLLKNEEEFIMRKVIITMLFILFLLFSCSKIISPEIPEVSLKNIVTMEFDFIPSVLPGDVFLVYADFDQSGYQYQPIVETLYRGDHKEYYEVEFSFDRNEIKVDYVQFKFVVAREKENLPGYDDVIIGRLRVYKEDL